MPNLGYSPPILIIITIIIILKITYLNFTMAGIPSLIILRSVKLFNFISSLLCKLVGGSHR